MLVAVGVMELLPELKARTTQGKEAPDMAAGVTQTRAQQDLL
jgi:hypothetical protein